MSMRSLLLLAAALAAAAPPAWAQVFPERPVRIVVPYSAGGATDVAARVLAEALTAALPQPVVVENRSGAAGMVGAEAVARSRPMATPCSSTTPATPCCGWWRRIPASTRTAPSCR
jgi:tripartite-type tricarboxylate transporter receptor subunit TctC